MCGFELVFGQLPVAVGIDLVEVLKVSFRTSAFDFFERELLVAVQVSVGEALAAFRMVRSVFALAILVAASSDGSVFGLSECRNEASRECCEEEAV